MRSAGRPPIRRARPNSFVTLAGVALFVSSLAAVSATTFGSVPAGGTTNPAAFTFRPPASTPPPATGTQTAPRTKAVDSQPRVVPAFVSVPAIGTTSPLIQLGLNSDATLEVPVDFYTAGWFNKGPRPGEPGAAVIAGHVDSYEGPAVFSRLTLLRPGDRVEVTNSNGSKSIFSVRRIDRYPKAYFPTEQVYGRTAASELRLITCGGPFDRKNGSYRDNVVVYANLVETITA